MSSPPSYSMDQQVVPGSSGMLSYPARSSMYFSGRDFFAESTGKEEPLLYQTHPPHGASSSPTRKTFNALTSFRSPVGNPMAPPTNGNGAVSLKAGDGSVNVVVWSGALPPRNAKESSFSCKVFLGGVPWDITEKDLNTAFGDFGGLRVEWPGIHDKNRIYMPKGHLYLIFDNENSVKFLLGACSYDYHHGQHNWFYKVASKRMLTKSVQVIPWQLADATYAHPGAISTTSMYKIFVANLHGMITAEGLGRIMNDLFGGVIAATLDTDKTKYPIGSGRITFNNFQSHMKAIRAGTVEIRTAKFSRKIKIDPYLEDTVCSMCHVELGPFFCRDLDCFRYFCARCYERQHGSHFEFAHHPHPMRRPARVASEEQSP